MVGYFLKITLSIFFSSPPNHKWALYSLNYIDHFCFGDKPHFAVVLQHFSCQRCRHSEMHSLHIHYLWFLQPLQVHQFLIFISPTHLLVWNPKCVKPEHSCCSCIVGMPFLSDIPSGKNNNYWCQYFLCLLQHSSFGKTWRANCCCYFYSFEKGRTWEAYR